MEAPRGSSRTALHVLFAVAALALAAAGVAYASLLMFTNFQLYDDEGYFQVLVRHLLDGRRIYDDVSTAYGPAWLGSRWLLHGVLGVALSSDGVRFLALATWIGCAALAGVLVRQATRAEPLSRWYALAASCLALQHLAVFADEPGHPADFAQLCLLGGLALFLAWRERRPLAAHALLGLAIGAQGWTKVNLGVYFLLPVLLLLLAGDTRRSLRICGWLVLAGTLLLPWVLMRAHLAQPWAPGLASVAGGGVLAAFLFARTEERSDRRRPLVWLGAGIAAATALALGFALAHGSTPAGLWQALVVLPSRFATDIVRGIRVPGDAALVAPLALMLAFFARAREGARPGWLLPAAEFGFGAFVLLGALPNAEWLIPYALPWAWIVLVRPETRAARVPLALCAPLQALQVFPVSGSQEALGTLLLVPLALIALADAGAALWRTRARPIAVLVTAALLVHIAGMLTGNVRALAATRAESERVVLPGVRWTRFEESTGARARFLADTLRGSFGDFLSVRGDGSQYGWTGIAPATGVIVSHSWHLFDERQQAELAAAYERAPRALLLDNRERISGGLRELPFFRMLERRYRAVARSGADELCVLREAPVPRLESCALLPEEALRTPGAKLELHWPAAVEDQEVARVQVANLVLHNLFADSAVPDERYRPRLSDGAELLFDGRTRTSVGVARLARAGDLRLELPQPLPPDQASFSCVRFFAPDGVRVVSLPVVLVPRPQR